MAQILGRTPEEMIGLSVFDTSTSRAARTSPVRPAPDGPHRRAPGRHRLLLRPPGRYDGRLGLISFRPVVDGDRRIGWLHRVTPYTHRKELLDTLAAGSTSSRRRSGIAHIGS